MSSVSLNYNDVCNKPARQWDSVSRECTGMYQVIRHGTHDHLAVFGLLLCRCAHGGMEGGQVIKLISHRSRQTPFNEITASLTQKKTTTKHSPFCLGLLGEKTWKKKSPDCRWRPWSFFSLMPHWWSNYFRAPNIHALWSEFFFLDTLERHTRLLSYISVATQGIYKADFFGCLSIQTCQQPCRHQHFFFSPTRQITTT